MNNRTRIEAQHLIKCLELYQIKSPDSIIKALKSPYIPDKELSIIVAKVKKYTRDQQKLHDQYESLMLLIEAVEDHCVF